jgi:hypothetical protein
MADLWYPKAVRDPAPRNLWIGQIATPAKHCLHTTEGGDGAYAPGQPEYFNNPYWPNYTLAKKAGAWVVFQHIPANWSGRALEANNAYVTQTEIATKAAKIGELPAEAMAVLTGLLLWEHAVRGLPMRSLVHWRGGEAYGYHAMQRLNLTDFMRYSGVLGHQHVPGNAHWDPGQFPIGRLFTPQEDDVAPEDIEKAVSKVLGKRFNPGQETPVEALERMKGRLDALATKVDNNTMRDEDIKTRLDNISNALKRLAKALAVPMKDLDLDPPGGPTTPDNYDPDGPL